MGTAQSVTRPAKDDMWADQDEEAPVRAPRRPGRLAAGAVCLLVVLGLGWWGLGMPGLDSAPATLVASKPDASARPETPVAAITASVESLSMEAVSDALPEQPVRPQVIGVSEVAPVTPIETTCPVQF